MSAWLGSSNHCWLRSGRFAVSVMSCSLVVLALQEAAGGQVAHHRAKAEGPRRCLVAGGDLVVQLAEQGAGVAHPVTRFVGEPRAQLVTVSIGANSVPRNNREAVGVLMVGVE